MWLANPASPSASMSHPVRRTDIDGLRVFAIFAVVLFHGALIPGGYIGVDVFFVISGYLMASIIQQGLGQGTFTFMDFYARRARRIFPAFVAVLAIVGILGCFLMLPADVKGLGRSIVAAAEFRSNFFFYENAKGYFTAESVQFEPLLHTWSLSVEMQFYLIFPVLLWAAFKYARAYVPFILAALIVLSLWHSQAMLAGNPQYAFYMLPARMWELLAGAIIFYLPPLKTWRLPAFVVALGLLFGPALLYTEETSFPGVAALVPVLGACLVMLARPGATAADGILYTIFTNPVTSYLANLSYSFYLWHWPLFVFARYNYGETLPWWLSVAVLGVSLGLAALVYHFVERPFLSAKSSARKTLGVQFALLIGLVLTGLLLRHAAPPVVQRLLPEKVLALYAGREDMLRKDCQPYEGGDGADQPDACRIGNADAMPSFAVWGDSFARMWLPAMDAQAESRGIAGRQIVRSACTPSDTINDRHKDKCAAFNQEALAYILANKDLKTIVLAAQWRNPAAMAPDIEEIARKLAADGRTVYFLINPPKPGYQVPRALAISELRGTPRPALQDADDYNRQSGALFESLSTARDESGLKVIALGPLLCPGGKCLVEADGRPLYSDSIHLTTFGAVRYKHALDDLFDAVEAKTR